MTNAAVTQHAPENRSSNFWKSGLALVLGIALVRFVLYLLYAPQYGYFRDELYYLACAEHPAWGYVDQPPMIAWIAWLLRHSIGTSLYALRLVPALAGVVTIFLAGCLSREFGGGRWAQALAALAALFATVYLGLSHLFTMNALDPPLWMALVIVVIKVVKTGNNKLWVWFGIITGIALLNKYAVAFFVIGLIAGVILTPLRKALLSKWLWIGAAIGIILVLPNFLWQANRGFPFLELMRNIRENGRDTWGGPIWFVGQQIQMLNPPVVVLLISALAFWFTRMGKQYRALGWAFVVTFLIMLALHGKNYYLAPVYPMVFAAGSVWFERIFSGTWLAWFRPAYAIVLVSTGALLAPLFLPVLPVPTFQRYTEKLGLAPPKMENQPQGALPQLYADMFGWQSMVRKVAAYYNSLPPEERARTAIYSTSYGAAGAIDFFGPKYGLPKSISGHQSYWYWGPRQYDGSSIIWLGYYDPDYMKRSCQSLNVVTVLDNPLARPDERGTVFHCHGYKWNFQTQWDKMKQFS